MKLASQMTLDGLRRMAVGASLDTPTTLKRAIDRLGFVQADPIRAPARAQDLTLRHRVKGYRAGDLEAKYVKLGIEEDFFVNYGFMPRHVQAWMHPRKVSTGRDAIVKKHGPAVLAFVGDKGEVHPRDVDQHFAHGSTLNAWGGQSSLTTHLLDGMHYRGLLRVTRRERGIRLYALPARSDTARSRDEIDTALDALIDLAMRKYAPLPQPGLQPLLGRIRLGAPQWRERLPAAIKRAKARWQQTVIDGVNWYWPEGIRFAPEHDDEVRLLAPFDPIVWDRARFELFWGWAYRFEAYTPAAKRKLGYYALPMLWRDRVIGWANATVENGALRVEPGYVSGRAPREKAFRLALDEEVARMETFLKR